MKLIKLSLSVIFALGFFSLVFFTNSCKKTIIKEVIKKDTVILTVRDTVIKKDTINFADTTALKNGLVVWYPFRRNTNDESGNSINGVLSGNAKLTLDERGVADGAIEFDGSGDAMIASPSAKFNLGNSVTISFKFMSRVDNQQQAYMGMESFSNGKASMLAIGTVIPGSAQFLHVGVVKPDVYICGNIPVTTDGLNFNSSFNPVEGIWYHFALTYTTTSYKVYINGSKIGEVATNGKPFPYCSGANLLIGTWWSGDMMSLNGKMDDIRIYNRLLSEKELYDLFKISLYLRKSN